MKIAIHQIQYMPGPRFFNKMKNCDLFILLDDVQYERREFQNRNKIRTAKGWQYITVPVLVRGKRFQQIKDVEINGEYDWQQEHLKAIRINYANAAHFRDYSEQLERIYLKKYDKLKDISFESIKFLRESLKITTPFCFSSEFAVKSVATERLLDLCKAAGANEYLSGVGGKGYLNETLFKKRNIKLIYQDYKYPEYNQQFEGFVPDLSALDLVLNCGRDAGEYV